MIAVGLAGVLAVLDLAAAPAAADHLAEIRARGELVWGGDIQGGEPYAFEDPSDPGHVIGFEVDIVDGIARRIGVRARFQHCTWSNLVPSLQRGDFDIIANGLEDTAERRDTLLLSQPYFVYAETLAVRKGASYTSLADLAGRRVGTLNQTFAQDLLRGRALEAVLYEGGAEPYLDLAAGRVDAVLLDNLVADRFGCTRPEIACVGEDVARGTYVVGMLRTDASLKAAVDAALADMTASGELRRILETWKLWDHRQTEPQALAVAAPPRPADELDQHQLWLFVQGAGMTVYLSAIAFVAAMGLGLVIAIGRIYGGRIRYALGAYVEIVRGTPLLLQLYVIYYGLAPIWKLDAVTAAIVGLALNYAAYEAEVYRGAILSVPRGQSDASHALGLSGWQTLRHVVLPQALRTALPAMTNDFVALLKDSSIVSVITVVELTKRATITAVDLRGWLVPGLMCATLYLAISVPLARLSRLLERRLQRDSNPRAA
jgi:polar amino acid transport system permease protein/polar amino acid transport system substrate-binding protein